MGRTNSQLSGGGTLQMNWDDLTALTFGNGLSENPYEFTIPKNTTTLADVFRQGNLRSTNLIIHNSGSAITSLHRAFQNSASGRHFTIDFDTSTVTDWRQTFQGTSTQSYIVIDGMPLDFSSATAISGCFDYHYYNANMQSDFRIAEGTLALSMNFQGNVTDDTLASIVKGLADLTGGTAQTLTLNTNVKARLTNEQIATITAKNWTLA